MAAKLSERTPIARYMRMSTDHQRYSLESQARAIGDYCASRNYEVVRSYIDAGVSGLSLAGRNGLKQLLADVVAPDRAFSRILVLDVSRWGRFQDPDEAAHYEFLCRAAGAPVEYCAEPFQGADGMVGAVLKSLKRVMAAEYSRELSAKVLDAQKLQAGLGFKMGAPVPHGLRRLVVDRQGSPKFYLKRGECKALQSDRVVLEWAGPDAKRTIRYIFSAFVKGAARSEIARGLNARGVLHTDGGHWTQGKVRTVLRSELAIGNYVFNRRGRLLQSPRFDNAPDAWIRTRVLEPVVSPQVFKLAQLRLSRRKRGRCSDLELLNDLKALLHKHGRLSKELINATPAVASSSAYVRRFGSMFAVYDLVGYQPVGAPNWRMRQRTNDELIVGLRDALLSNPQLSAADINTLSQLPHASTYIKRFGSLGVAYALAGYQPPHFEAAAVRWQAQRGSVLRFTQEELLSPLRAMMAEHGYLSAALIAQNRDCPSRSTYVHRFGSLFEAFRRVGYVTTAKESRRRGMLLQNTRRRARRPANVPTYAHEVLAHLKDLYAREGFLSGRLVEGDPNLPSPSTIARMFGKLSIAFKLAGYVPDKSRMYRNIYRWDVLKERAANFDR